jgi:hypothetical protein
VHRLVADDGWAYWIDGDKTSPHLVRHALPPRNARADVKP